MMEAWKLLQGLLQLHPPVQLHECSVCAHKLYFLRTWYLMTEQLPRAHGTVSAEDSLYISQVKLFQLSAGCQSCLPHQAALSLLLGAGLREVPREA